MNAPAPMTIRRFQAGWAAGCAGPRVFFAEQADEAAERQDVDRVLGLAALKPKSSRRVADAELQHLDAEELGREEVPGLVDDDEDDQDAEERAGWLR